MQNFQNRIYWTSSLDILSERALKLGWDELEQIENSNFEPNLL